ncbi:MAG: iron ABC transporter permease, partial [Candidatus Eremiobacteraeota bacterium]|nr:iron ABC transporter permease [Candidatus Eremiobacteraeota bacterium]
MRTTRWVIGVPLCLFLFVFLVVPLSGLLLAAFVGEPTPLLAWILNLQLAPFLDTLREKGTLLYFSEFFETPRYYKGFFNAVGLAPVILTIQFFIAWLGQKLLPATRRFWSLLGGPGLLATFLLVCLGAASRPLWASDDGIWGKILNGSDIGVRLLQACGYCPLVTLVASVIGVGVAFCLHSTNLPYKKFFSLLVIVPLSTPPFLGALAFKNLLGDFGMITRLFEAMGLSHPFVGQSALSAGMVQSFLFFPFVTLTTVAALERFDNSLPEASRVLGGSQRYGFLTVTLPTLLPGILAGAFLVFVRSFGDFATLKLLLPIQYSMIVVEAYRDLSGNVYWGGATMLSTLMVVVILTLLTLQKYVVEGGSYQTVTGRSGARAFNPGEKRTTADKAAFLFCSAVFSVPLLFLASTFLVSIARNWGAEIAPSQFTFNRYFQIAKLALTQWDSPLVNSFNLTIPALVGCVVISFSVAFLISRGKGKSAQVLDFVTVLPFVIPGVAFAVALIGVFNTEPFDIFKDWWLIGSFQSFFPRHFEAPLVIYAYIVTRAPYGVRTILASFQQIGTSMEEGSRTLGAGELLTLLRVTVPLVLPGI